MLALYKRMRQAGNGYSPFTYCPSIMGPQHYMLEINLKVSLFCPYCVNWHCYKFQNSRTANRVP